MSRCIGELFEVGICSSKSVVYRQIICSLCSRSVISRATLDAPMILPLESLIGETVSDIVRTRPSFVCRFVM